MKARYADAVISLIALAISITVAVSLPNEVPDVGWNTLVDMNSAAFFPLLAAIVLAIGGIVLMFQAVASGKTEDDERVAPFGRHPWLMAIGFVVIIPAIHLLGMMTASALAIVFLPFVFGYRDFRWILPLAVVIPTGVYFLFEKVLNVLFPHGAIF